MLAFRYRRLRRVRARASFVSIARARQITADSASPRRSFPSSRRGFEPPRPVVRARARHPPAKKNARHHRGRTPNGTLGVWLPSSLKQTHTEETQDGDDPHTSPAKSCLKSCLRSRLKSCLKSCLRSPRPVASVEIGASRSCECYPLVRYRDVVCRRIEEESKEK